MQPVEAITRLLAIADNRHDGRSVDPDDENEKLDELAVGIIQAMLNTALPVARFRLFVRMESGPNDGCEFTVCATKIEEIVAAVMPLTLRPVKVYVSLWEQRPTGADMLAGYQGMSRPVHGGLRKNNKLSAYLNGLLRNYGSAS